jgi:transcriptional regulator with XRE-family HTH domain
MAHESRAEVSLIQQLRFDRGLTLDQVAREAHVAHKTLQNLEQGITEKPIASSLHKVAVYYGVPASELLNDLRARRRERDDASAAA